MHFHLGPRVTLPTVQFAQLSYLALRLLSLRVCVGFLLILLPLIHPQQNRSILASGSWDKNSFPRSSGVDNSRKTIRKTLKEIFYTQFP